MTDGDLLFQGILDDPDDNFLKLVYADWWEDQGEPTQAECWWWLAKHNSRPSHLPNNPRIRLFWNESRYLKYEMDKEEYHIPRSALPDVWLILVNDDWYDDEHNGKLINKAFVSLENAYREAVAGYCKLTQEQREGIQKWTPTT